MSTGMLMAVRTDAHGNTDSELVVVLLEDDGLLRLKLDDGQRIELDFDELLAIAAEDEGAAAAHGRAA